MAGYVKKSFTIQLVHAFPRSFHFFVFSLLCPHHYPLCLGFGSLPQVPFHLTDIFSRLLYKLFSLRESSAHISTRVIPKKIWIIEAISCRNKSQIIIIKITKLPCHLTIFVSLHAVYSKREKKRNLSFCNLCWSHEYYPFIMPFSPGWLISYSHIKDFEVAFLWCSDEEKEDTV